MGDVLEGSVAGLAAEVDGLLSADLDMLDAPELAGLLERLEVQRRRLEAVDARVLAVAHEQHVASEFCRGSTADLLVQQLRVSPHEARRRVRRAVDLGPRHTVLGQALDPIHPILAAALAQGTVSGAHADLITRTLGRIPPDIASEAMPAAEWFLVQAATHENPTLLAQSAKALLERLDPDGDKPRDEAVHRRRRFGLHRDNDGSWTPYGSLTDETGLVWQTILDALSAPRPATTGLDGAVEADPRTAEQRRHDGLLEAGLRLLRSGSLPDTGGTPTTVTLTMGIDDLIGPDGQPNPDGIVHTEHGHRTRLRNLFGLLGEAELVPLLFDRSQIDCELFLGRTQRLANRAQRRALAARDGGCCFPGCDRPASWCEVHHVLEWILGGTTDITNLCLLCPFHHREFERRGWAVAIVGGEPWWTPPSWLDPDQRPVQNAVHHLRDIVFDPDGTIAAAHRRP